MEYMPSRERAAKIIKDDGGDYDLTLQADKLLVECRAAYDPDYPAVSEETLQRNKERRGEIVERHTEDEEEADGVDLEMIPDGCPENDPAKALDDEGDELRKLLQDERTLPAMLMVAMHSGVLTNREWDVVYWEVAGCCAKRDTPIIAAMLGCDPKTVQRNRASAYRKMEELSRRIYAHVPDHDALCDLLFTMGTPEGEEPPLPFSVLQCLDIFEALVRQCPPVS